MAVVFVLPGLLAWYAVEDTHNFYGDTLCQAAAKPQEDATARIGRIYSPRTGESWTATVQ